jgi:uncharacterized protein YjbI with pentapeptide repeats
MRVFKPQRLGLLHRTYEHDRRVHFAVTLFAFFKLDAPARLLPEVNMWKLVGEELGEGGVFDVGMPKVRGEVLVVGKAYPPMRPGRACSVRVRAGAVDKTLYVVGDRRWDGDEPTEPEPFDVLPITWSHAFGGEGYAPNPLGKGFAPVEVGGELIHFLPNVEDPKQPITGPRHRPERPAGLGAFDFTWPQRFDKLGTYDAHWQKELMPGFAADIDWTVFNAAPPDQWVERYFEGGEELVLENLHPERPTLEGRLPELVGRVFVLRRGASEPEELTTRFETVWLFPHRERGVAVFRGQTEVAEDDAGDLTHLMVGFDDKDTPRPLSHYRKVFADRQDPERGHVHAMREADLLPAKMAGSLPVPDDKIGDVADLMANDGVLLANQRRRQERALVDAREKILAAGLDPDAYLPAELPPVETPAADPAEGTMLAMDMLDEMRDQAAARRKAIEDDLKNECEAHGLDFDAIMDNAKKGGGGPPSFSADVELVKLRGYVAQAQEAGADASVLEAKLEDPTFEARLRKLEEAQREGYRRFAQHFPPASRLTGDDALRLRAEFLDSRRRGEAMARRNWTGIDLSGLDLSGLDLSGAWLEASNLAGASLAGCDLTGAVVARSDLSGADLSAAQLAGANLAGASLRGARAVTPPNLEGAVLDKADLGECELAGARLAGASLAEANLEGADLSAIEAPQANFSSTVWRGVKVRGANLTQAVLHWASLEDADFSDVDLSKAVLMEARGARARFVNAKLVNLRVVKQCTFDSACFDGADLSTSSLRGMGFARATFLGARLDKADLSECNLEQADLTGASAVEALFMKANLTEAKLFGANLMQALLTGARLSGADLRESNLFGADFAKVKVDGRTQVGGANMKRVRVAMRSEDGQS